MNRLKVTLVRSPIGSTEKQHLVLRGLGLRKLQSSVTHSNSPTIRGMVKKVIHLLRVEELND
ncbi:MAG: 50S ribosomal protein L30 [Myxococcota bacterium]|jgi:large subunit ribosomal protein L30